MRMSLELSLCQPPCDVTQSEPGAEWTHQAGAGLRRTLNARPTLDSILLLATGTGVPGEMEDADNRVRSWLHYSLTSV